MDPRLNPVAWTEGMFLRPQHLQQRDRFEDERLRYHLRAVNPFHWGVRELLLDEEALGENRVSVLRLDAVLPGGGILRYPGNAVVETREFDPSLERIDVHLGLRHASPSEPNAAPAGNGVNEVRSVLRSEELPDWNRGGFETPIELAYPNARLFFGEEEHQLELHESFKLAEIVATGDTTRPFALSPGYAPPLLVLQACPPLFDDVTKVVSQMAAKVKVVAGRTETIAIADLPRMWIRYTLARVVPLLRHLMTTGKTLPFDLYTALVEAAAALGAFRFGEPVELPLYDHEDLGGCFRELLRFIDLRLREELEDRGRELPMPFDPERHAYVTDALSVELVGPRNRFYLAVKAEMDSKELVSLVVDHGKASSRERVPWLVRFEVKGLRLEHLPAAPTEVGARSGCEYFKVEPHGPEWAKVREEYAFAVDLGRLDHAQVWLNVVTPEG